MNETLALFIADLNRSINGLSQSLKLGEPAFVQAAVHARDLSDALHGMDLSNHAELAFSLSKQLACENPETGAVAAEFLLVVKELLDALIVSKPVDEVFQKERLEFIAKSLFVFEENSTDLNSAAYLPTEEVHLDGLAHDDLHNLDPIKPVGLSDIEPTLSEGLARISGVQHLVLSALSPEIAKRAIFAFSDYSNWLANQHSYELMNIFQGMIQQIRNQEVRVDHIVAHQLSAIAKQFSATDRLEYSARQMTVFVDVFAENQSQSKLAQIQEKISQIYGRVDKTQTGYRMIFPSTLKRLRVVSFRRNQNHYAISWAQFLGAKTSVEDNITVDLLGQIDKPRICLEISAEEKKVPILAHELKPFSIATVLQCPVGVSLPRGVAGFAVGPETQPLIFLSPKEI